MPPNRLACLDRRSRTAARESAGAGTFTPMTGTRRRIIDTPHGQVHVRMAGGEGGGRPLLLLHQSPRSGRMFEPLMERLRRPTLAPDRLGYGFSDAGPDEPGIETYAEATMMVVDHAGWDSFDVLGIHTGSMEAVAIGVGWPEQVGRVAIVAVPVFSPEEAAEIAALYAEPRARPVEDGSHLLEYWRARLVWRDPPYDLDHLQTLTVEELLVGDRAHVAYRAVVAWPMRQKLAELAAPLVVFAPHDDLISQTSHMRERLPSGTVYVDLPDMAMDIFHRHPDEMASLVREHLPA